MCKIALFITMLLLPCVSFAGLLSSNNPTTPISREYRQQLMDSPVYVEVFKEERMPDLYVKMGKTYQLLDSYWICSYPGGLGLKQCQGDFKSPEGFYSITRSQFKPDSRFYKAISIGSLNAYDRAHGHEGKYLMIYGNCVSVDCYAMIDSEIDEILQPVIGASVFGQSSAQVSIYPFCMTNANMERHKYSYYADFWKQFKPGYDYFQQTYKLPIVLVTDGRYMVSKPLSHEVVQPQLASNHTLSETK